MNRLSEKVVLVTGASMGIGEAIARAFAAEGAQLVIAARSADKLEALARALPPGALVIKVDMSQPDEVRGMVERTVQQFGRIDILVNNAAVGMYASVADMKPDQFEHLVRTNWLGPVLAIQAAVPHMRRQGTGQIINISSVAGKVALPWMGAYCSTKFALNALSNSLRMELAPDNIGVLLVCPGRVKTPFTENAFKDVATRPLYPGGITAERVAQAVLRASLKGKREIMIPADNRILGWMRALLPSLVDRMIAWVLRPQMRRRDAGRERAPQPLRSNMEAMQELAAGSSHLIDVAGVVRSLDSASPDQCLQHGRRLCEQLEAGNILFFAESPFALPREDREFLLTQRQTDAAYHKNIAYRPAEDRLTGLDKAVQAPDAARLRTILRSYSNQSDELLRKMFAPYAGRWRRDFASFRAVEERGRKMRLRARNDLPHTDAFPTRPTHGDRILRVFTNLNPTQARIWITSDTFDVLAERFAQTVGLPRRARESSVGAWLRCYARGMGLPLVDRSPYDEFMLRFHNFLKENSGFQDSCRKDRWELPPGSSWMVYTDMASHAVLEGQYAMEQTFLVSREAMVLPDKAPIAVLERLCGYPLATARC